MNDLHDLAAPYLLGALSESEQSAFETHLDSCDTCQIEVQRLEAGLVAMAGQDAEHPSGQVRDRVLSQIEDADVVELKSWRRFGGYLVPSMAAVAILIVAFAVALGSDPVEDVLGADDAVVTAFTVTDAYADTEPGVARVVFSETAGGAVVEFQGLRQTVSNQVYQLWLIDDGVATAAGVFTPEDDGSATVLLAGDPVSGETVGITNEPSGGSPTPTGDVLFAAEI